MNGEQSSWFKVLNGIPQGSILGPSLFLICINDLPELCAVEDPGSEIYLYADDSKIYSVYYTQIYCVYYTQSFELEVTNINYNLYCI